MSKKESESGLHTGPLKNKPLQSLDYKGFLKWNWWVSNPRPNKESKSFLHVYLILIFEIEVEISNQVLFLSSKSFASLQKK